MSFPRIRTVEQGIFLLFPELSAIQRKRLREIIFESLRRIIQEEWGVVYANADPEEIRERMREELEKGLRLMDVRGPEIIAERFSRALNADELVRAVGEWFYFKDRFDKAAFQDLVDRIWDYPFCTNLKRINDVLKGVEKDLKEWKDIMEHLKNAQENMKSVLIENVLRSIEDQLKKMESEGKLSEELKENVNKLKDLVNEIVEETERAKIEDRLVEDIKGEIEEVEKKKRELERIFENPDVFKTQENLRDELSKRIKELIPPINDLLTSLAELRMNLKDLHEELGSVRKKIEDPKIEKTLREIIEKLPELEKKKEAEKTLREIIERLKKEIEDHERAYKSFDDHFRVLEVFWKGLKDQKDEDIKRISGEISKKIFEGVRNAVQASLVTEEALEKLVVDVMNRMVRKDLSLYIISQLKRNPLEELYMKLRRGEEI